MKKQPQFCFLHTSKLITGLFLSIYILFLCACQSNYFDDNKLINLLDYKDQRDSVEVLNAIENEENGNQIKLAAIEALGTMQPSNAKKLLLSITKNKKESESIRQIALFSLGQYRDSAYSAPIISLFDKESEGIQNEMLKALGKMGGQQALSFYLRFDEKQLKKHNESYALSLVYFSKKQYPAPKLIDQAIVLLNEQKYPSSSLAANALSNWKESISEQQAIQIIANINQLKSTAQFHALKSLNKWAKNLNLNKQFIGLKEKVSFENEHALLTLIDFKTNENLALEWVKNGLNTASEIALANQSAKWTESNQNLLLTQLQSNRAKSVVYRNQLLNNIASKNNSDTLVSKNIISLYHQTEWIYDKGFVLQALGESWKNLSFLENEMNSTSDLIIRQKAFEAILKIRQSKNYILFDQEWKKEFPKSNSIDNYFGNIINQAIASRDVGLLAQSCELLLQKELINSEKLLNMIDASELNYRLSNLQLPRDIEIYNLTLQLISKISNKPFVPKLVSYNNAIDWAYIKRLPKTVSVVFKTNKGNFEVECNTQLTPGTVAQFCRLVGSGFYDGKVFHRVVPNFVVQGGCPRGDGYGSTNETIRSEFINQSFTNGMVGMASAGKDTESCQFFVMTGDHPHLDGRYTLFGKVSQGIEVILKLEEGDQIIQADFKP